MGSTVVILLSVKIENNRKTTLGHKRDYGEKYRNMTLGHKRGYYDEESYI